ncbi:MAG: hypothetical protein IPM29_22725 [Planctomycetes bacterium]|nr:hypothetical protein [Planctomycetota bacterium]
MVVLPVNIVVEGPTDEAVARRLLDDAGLLVDRVFGGRGKSNLDARLAGFAKAARRSPWFVLRDLDQDADCAPTLVARLVPVRPVLLSVRIAVRELEAWLLADRERAASWLGVSVSLVPRDPDSEPNPKSTLLNLARRSKHRAILEDLIPPRDSTSIVGRGYRSQILRFASERWRPSVAALSSDSLARCLRAVDELKRQMGR